MDKINVLLFAMTGFGNSAFAALYRDRRVSLSGVFTPKRAPGPFPYYRCRPLHEAVSEKKTKLFEGLKLSGGRAQKLVRSLGPDLIVVSTFDQIIPESIIPIPRLGVINVHPSLLPQYRGATPTVWALANGEKETGVTVHFIEDKKLDAGRIITQSRLKIRASDTDGSLRRRLAGLSAKMLPVALRLVMGKKKRQFRKQDEGRASYFPKRTPADGELRLDRPLKDIANHIRAFLPYPGAYVLCRGKKRYVKGVRFTGRAGPAKFVFTEAPHG